MDYCYYFDFAQIWFEPHGIMIEQLPSFDGFFKEGRENFYEQVTVEVNGGKFEISGIRYVYATIPGGGYLLENGVYLLDSKKSMRMTHFGSVTIIETR